MNKPINTFALSLLLLLLGACSSDTDGLHGSDGTQSLTVKVNVDAGIVSRAAEDNEVPKTCHFGVFEKKDDGTYVLHGEEQEFAEVGADGTFTFRITDLSKEKDYRIAAWVMADYPVMEHPYYDKMESRHKEGGVDLRDVRLKPGYIAWAGSKDINVLDGSTVNMELKYAVARIDLEHTGEQGLNRGDNVTIGNNDIRGYKYKYDVVTGTTEAIDEKPDPIRIGEVISETNLKGTVLTAYVLVPSDGQTLDITIEYAKSGSNLGKFSLEVPNVPLRPNCRTVIRGDVTRIHTGVSQQFAAQLDTSWSEDNTDF